MRGPHLQSQVTLQLCVYVINQKFYLHFHKAQDPET